MGTSGDLARIIAAASALSGGFDPALHLLLHLDIVPRGARHSPIGTAAIGADPDGAAFDPRTRRVMDPESFTVLVVGE
jgi:hypothetical protein